MKPTEAPGKRRHRRVRPRMPPPELFGDTDGQLLSPAHQRKLGAPALAVWQELLRVRGNAAVPFDVSLVQLLVTLRSRSMLYFSRLRDAGWSPSRIDRAMARLKEAGLIAQSQRVVVVTYVDGAKRFTSQLRLIVHGAVRDAEPRDTLWVPSVTIRWCETAPGRGGFRHGNGGQTDATGGQSDAEPLPRNADLDGQTAASKILEESDHSSLLSVEKNAAAGAAALFHDQHCQAKEAPPPTRPAKRLTPAELELACRHEEHRIRSSVRQSDGQPFHVSDLVLVRIVAKRWPPYERLRLAELGLAECARKEPSP